MLDPIAEDIFKRAWEKSRDREDPDVLVIDIIEAVLHRGMTVSLFNHFMQAATIAEERGDDGLYDQHLLLAMSNDGTLLGVNRNTLMGELDIIQRKNREAAE